MTPEHATPHVGRSTAGSPAAAPESLLEIVADRAGKSDLDVLPELLGFAKRIELCATVQPGPPLLIQRPEIRIELAFHCPLTSILILRLSQNQARPHEEALRAAASATTTVRVPLNEAAVQPFAREVRGLFEEGLLKILADQEPG